MIEFAGKSGKLITIVPAQMLFYKGFLSNFFHFTHFHVFPIIPIQVIIALGLIVPSKCLSWLY